MPNTPALHYIRGPTKNPPTTIQAGVSGKIAQKKTQSHWTQCTCAVGKRHFLLGRFRMYLPQNVNDFQLAIALCDEVNIYCLLENTSCLR